MKVGYCLGSAESALGFINSPGGLWYHAIGLFNAFYSLNEEMVRRTQNSADANLNAAIVAWRANNKEKIDSFFGKARQIATHRGGIYTEEFQHWEIDHANDTEHPYMRSYVTVDDTDIKRMEGSDFIELCLRAMTFMREGIVEIDVDYRARGGGQHALPPDLRDEDLF
ncbi:hypothetical protein SAMN06295998_101568 [Primorskyibacter flagellatus]|uniref:Uncharacterized protein n=1 Tax=Primorskyibacter flagellatus TaxID=1387277 RepID=A0A1W1ZGT4_9RHOB|nr:hypothetical protein SAMN06295998_101568 [Primorskyibacter flagellatus]